MSEALQALQCCSVLHCSQREMMTSVIGVTLGPKVPGGATRGQTLGLMSDTWADENL